MFSILQKLLGLAESAVQVEMYSYLMGTLIWFSVALGMFFGGRFLKNKVIEDDIDAEFIHAIGYVLMGVAFMPALAGLWNWVDPWTWVALNHPDLYLAKRLTYI